MTNGALSKVTVKERRFVGGAFTPARKRQIERFVKMKGREVPKPGEIIPLKTKPITKEVSDKVTPTRLPVSDVTKVTPVTSPKGQVVTKKLPAFVPTPPTEKAFQETVKFVPQFEAKQIEQAREEQLFRETGGEQVAQLEKGLRESLGVPKEKLIEKRIRGPIASIMKDERISQLEEMKDKLKTPVEKTIVEKALETARQKGPVAAIIETEQRIKREKIIGSVLAIPSIPSELTQFVTKPTVKIQKVLGELKRDPFRTLAQTSGITGGVTAFSKTNTTRKQLGNLGSKVNTLLSRDRGSPTRSLRVPGIKGKVGRNLAFSNKTRRVRL